MAELASCSGCCHAHSSVPMETLEQVKVQEPFLGWTTAKKISFKFLVSEFIVKVFRIHLNICNYIAVYTKRGTNNFSELPSGGCAGISGSSQHEATTEKLDIK